MNAVLRTSDGRRFDLGPVAGSRHEPEPWAYPRFHPAHGQRPYTLLIYGGGFKQRIYDWEGSLAVTK